MKYDIQSPNISYSIVLCGSKYILVTISSSIPECMPVSICATEGHTKQNKQNTKHNKQNTKHNRQNSLHDKHNMKHNKRNAKHNKQNTNHHIHNTKL